MFGFLFSLSLTDTCVYVYVYIDAYVDAYIYIY